MSSLKIQRRDTIRELAGDIESRGDAPLSREEESRLGRIIQDRNSPRKRREDAIGRLMACNLPFVIAVAKRQRLPGEDLGELVADGTIGLRRAAELFDPEGGFKFITYADAWIKQAIHRGRVSASYGRPWRVPHYLHDRRAKVESHRRALADQGEAVTVEEAANRLGIGQASLFPKIDRVLLQQDGESGPGGESYRDCDGFADDRIPSPDEQLERMDQIRMIQRYMRRLGPQEREIIRLYYGFDEVPGIRRETGRVAQEPGGLIAKHLGISRERVRQIRQSALTKFRRWAEEDECF